MKKMIAFCGLVFGSYIGWWLGAKIGITSAVILSSIGTGIGLYYGRRIANNLFG
jgi:hypothetical protein